MAKTKLKTMFVCSSCGEESITWQGRCPNCGEWNTFKSLSITPSSRGETHSPSEPLYRLDEQKIDESPRLPTGLNEFDRVLGGGVFPGSVILLGGDPGVGKSTLLLQTANYLSRESKIIYFSGEESRAQVAHRAARLNLSPSFLFSNETRIATIRSHIQSEKPECIIIDSIQTLYDDSFPSTPGSLVQVRECALQLQDFAKQQGTSVFLIGHITKEGAVAGPKTLEHMVDVVLYLEGESSSEMRLLRSIKNRFGATNEIGLFEFHQKGLSDVVDPAYLFTEERVNPIAGTALTAVCEGERPIIVEIQALVTPTPFGYPKRTSSGFDLQRLHILLAVLERRVGCSLASSDVFVNIVGGYHIRDRAADLGVCMAIVSAVSGRPLPEKHVFWGEVGLTGEIRRKNNDDRRTKEVERLGYKLATRRQVITELIEAYELNKGSRRARGH
jgi:DNA repair protein RadA/Sms